jgi:hypothetical protein
MAYNGFNTLKVSSTGTIAFFNIDLADKISSILLSEVELPKNLYLLLPVISYPLGKDGTFNYI